MNRHVADAPESILVTLARAVDRAVSERRWEDAEFTARVLSGLADERAKRFACVHPVCRRPVGMDGPLCAPEADCPTCAPIRRRMPGCRP